MSSTEHKAAIHFPTLCISVSPKGKSCSLIPGNFIYFPLLCEMAICSLNISQVSLETKCTKDASWGLGVYSLLYSLLPPHPIKLSHSSHKSQWNYTVEQNCTFSTLWANPVGHLKLNGKTGSAEYTVLSLFWHLRSSWDGNSTRWSTLQALSHTDPGHTLSLIPSF